MKYIVEIRRYRKNVYAFTTLYAFDTLQKMKERTGNLNSDETVINVKEYHLVHEHGRKLHSCDGFFEMNEEEGCYSNHVKLSNKQGI